MATGIVKWFNHAKGYGFIVPDEGGNDVFVHITAVQEANIPALDEGQRIQYDLGDGPNDRKVAINLSLTESAES